MTRRSFAIEMRVKRVESVLRTGLLRFTEPRSGENRARACGSRLCVDFCALFHELL